MKSKPLRLCQMLFFWKCFCVNSITEAQETLVPCTHVFNCLGHSTIFFHFKTVWVGQKGSEKITLWRWNECTWGSSWIRVMVCQIWLKLEEVVQSCQLSWRLWLLTARSQALQRLLGLFAHKTRTWRVGASVSSCVCVRADAVCNTWSRLIASMNVSRLWCLNVTHVM